MKITKRLQNKLNKYPNNFFDFVTGINVSNDDIKEDLIKIAENISADNPFSFISTGNVMVFAYRIGPDKFGKYDVTFMVCKNYQELTLNDVDLDNINVLNKPKNFFDI